MSIIEQARKTRAAMIKSAEFLDDATASTAPDIFPRLKQVNANSGDIPLVTAGTRINWAGVVKRAAVDLWDTPENNPDNAPALWEDISYRNGYRIIPDTITAGTAFSNGEYGWWGDELYASLLDNNVWTPEQYAAAWKKV